MNAAATVSAALSGSPERLPRWANTLLVIAIGIALAFLVLKAVPTFLPVAEASVGTTNGVITNTNRAANGPNPRELASAISKQHLFGDFSAAPVAEIKEEPKRGPAPKTRLNLKLAGVFAYSPVERSMAIISVDNGDQEAFRIGSRIVGETTLEEVHRDHIIIKNRGKLEKVSMAEDIKPLPASQTQAATRPTQANAGAGAGVDPNAPIELPSTSPGAIRDYLARNPALLGRVVAAEPYQENGKLLGYKITPKQNPEILEAQGIVAGDVITRVNNIQINSQKQGIRALRNVVKAEQLEVMVLRNGVEVPLSISLTQ